MAAFHIGFAHANPAQKFTQLGQILGSFFTGTQIGFGNHLNQGHATAVEVNHALPMLEFGLAGIFFKVHFVDAHASGFPIRHVQVQVSALANRLKKLGDLKAFG